MTPPRRLNAKNVALAVLSIYSILALPIVLLFAGNWMYRYHFFNLGAHYRSKIEQPYTLHAGDSITAGAGHWPLLLGRSPFSSITLAENGYTVRQITSQVSSAKQYRPYAISIMAGTNDIFHPRYRLQDVLLDYRDMLEVAEDAADRCIVTLPTKTKDISKAKAIAKLNSNLKALIQNSKCQVLDLNPVLAPNGMLLEEYTTDGVHLSQRAYKEWAKQLKRALSKVAAKQQ